MSQIFSGEGLGLSGSSLDKLGAYGPKDHGKLSQAGGRAYVNAFNGNLVLNQTDGFLMQHDLEFGLSHSYNSLVTPASEAWRFNVSSIITDPTLPINAKGAKATRLGEAGHRTQFVYNQQFDCYFAQDGSTARLKFTANQWHYTHSDSDIVWLYDSDGQLTERVNKDGLRIIYQFDEARLSQISDSSGQFIKLAYTNGLLCELVVSGTDKIPQRIHYEYDSLKRLTRVTQALEKDKIYAIDYEYDGQSQRISRVAQSDGSQFHVAYDRLLRVSLTRDAMGHTHRYSYDKNTTTISNDKNESWNYHYDSDAQLSGIDGPEGYRVSYHYSQKRLIGITQGQINWRFEYNAEGDCIKSIDDTGVVTERSFDEEHRLIQETVYSDFDVSQGVSTRRWLYDLSGHLRFEIAANGVVKEHRYDAEGNQVQTIDYLKSRISRSLDSHELTLNILIQWSKTQAVGKDVTQRVFDVLGQLSQETHGKLTTHFIYSPHGQLLSKIKPLKEGFIQTHYVYDLLGRLIKTIDNQGHCQDIEYDDVSQRVITTESNGLKIIKTYDRSRALLFEQSMRGGIDYGTIEYRYDELGQLIQIIGATGGVEYLFYDKQGRRQASISAEGTVCEWRYNDFGHIAQSTVYATQIDGANFDEFLSNYEKIKPQPTAEDRCTDYYYGLDNRLKYQVDGEGFLTGFEYDVNGRVIKHTAYAKRLSVWHNIKTSDFNPIESIDDRVSKFYFDEVGNKIAQVDGENYATQFDYDNRGLLISHRRFYHKAREGTNWSESKPSTNRQDITSLFFYDVTGVKIAEINGENFLREYSYDCQRNLTKQYAYYTPVTKSYDVDSVINQLKPEKHPNDEIVTYRYDSQNRLLNETRRDLLISHQYDEMGNEIKKISTDKRTNLSRHEIKRYDSLGRLTDSLEGASASLLDDDTLSKQQINSIWKTHAKHFGYDLNGNLISQTNQLQQTTHLYYDQDRRLIYTFDVGGRVTKKTYNAFSEVTEMHSLSKRVVTSDKMSLTQLQGQVKTLFDARRDKQISNRYTLTGSLKSVSQGSQKTLYQYNAFGEVCKQFKATQNEQFNVLSHGYDRRGLAVISVEDASGLNRRTESLYDAFCRLQKTLINAKMITQLVYDKRDNIRYSVNAMNKITHHSFDAFNRLLSSSDNTSKTVSRYQYDDKNNTVYLEKLDAGITTLRSNAFGETVQRIDALGFSSDYYYDANGLLAKCVDANGHENQYHYDKAGLLSWQENSDGQVIAYTYDANACVLSKTLSPQDLKLTTRYEYDGVGRKIKSINQDGCVIQFEYDVSGQLIQQILDPNGLQLSTYFDYDSLGNKISETHTNSLGQIRTTQYAYDKLNRLISTTISPESLKITHHFEYDERDNLITEIDPMGRVTQSLFDEMNRMRFRIDAQGGVIEHRYDVNGNTILIRAYGKRINLTGTQTIESLDSQLVIDTHLDRIDDYRFDAQGRVVFHSNALGYVCTYKYDEQGNVLIKRKYAEPLDRQSSTNELSHPPSSKKDRVIRYVYDGLSRMRYEIDSSNYVISRDYDASGNVIRLAHHSNRLDVLKSQEFDDIKAQLILSSQDRVTRFIYDKANRIQYEINPLGFISETQYSINSKSLIQYSQALDLESFSPLIDIITTEQDRISYQKMDEAGRVIHQIDAEGAVTSYEYDLMGNVVKEIFHASKGAQASSSPSDRVNEFRYDEANRLTEKIFSQDKKESLSYDAVGNLLAKTNQAGLEWRYEYDENNQLIRTHSPKTRVTDYLGETWVNLERHIVTEKNYDPFGNVTKLINDKGFSNQTLEYRYDKLNRLIKSVWPRVSIDSSGLGETSVRKERVVDLSTESVFNAFGQLIAEKDKAGNWCQYVYDNRGNKSHEVSYEGRVTSFQYDAFSIAYRQVIYAKLLSANLGKNELNIDDVAVLSSDDDRHTSYTYDKLNNLICMEKQTSPNYDSKRQRYDNSGQLKPLTKYQYNAFGDLIYLTRRINEIDWSEERTYFDKLGRRKAEVNSELYLTEYNYDSFGQLCEKTEYAKAINEVNKDSYASANKSRDDRRETFIYDKQGNLITTTLRDITYQRLKGSSYEEVVGDLSSHYTFDALGNLTSSTNHEGQSTYHYYDNLGREIATVGPDIGGRHEATTISYDSLSQAVSQTVWVGGANTADLNHFILNPDLGDESHTTKSFYDDAGRLVSRLDASNSSSSYSYDANGNLTRMWRFVSDADGALHVQDLRYQYNAENCQIMTTTFERDGKLIHEKSRFNSFGELIEQSFDGQFAIQYDYNVLGQVWRTNKEGFYQIFLHDLLGNITQEVKSTNQFLPDTKERGQDLSAKAYENAIDFSSDTSRLNLQRSDTLYDKSGHVIEIVIHKTEGQQLSRENYLVDRWGNSLEYTDVFGKTTQSKYNAFNQALIKILPEVSVMDEHGKATRQNPRIEYAYDVLGQVIAIKDANRNIHSKEYDAQGRVINEIDALGESSHQEYDLFGNVIKSIKRGVTSYEYDKNNQLITQVNAKGEACHFTNDELGQRLTQKNAMGETIAYRYDNRSNLITKTDIRGLATHFVFDDASHKVKETNANHQSQTWDYDAVSARVTSHRDLSGHITTFNYNLNGLLLHEESTRGKNINYHYWGNGLLRQFDDAGLKQVTNYDYDIEGKLLQKNDVKSEGQAGWLVENDYYHYDELGRLKSLVRFNANKTHRYFEISYDYDAENNIRHTKSVVNLFDKTLIEESYFNYDSNNRVLISKGVLIDGEITISKLQGTSMHYNADGSIADARKYLNGHYKEFFYAFDELGRIKLIKQRFDIKQNKMTRLRALAYDGAGRVYEETLFDEQDVVRQFNQYAYGTQKDDLGLLKSQFIKKNQRATDIESSIFNDKYDLLGNLKQYRQVVYGKDHVRGYTTTHDLDYYLGEGYLLSADKAFTKDTMGHTAHGESVREFDVNGHLSKVKDLTSGCQIDYLNDARIGIKARKEPHQTKVFLNVLGDNIADVTLDKQSGQQHLDVYGGFSPRQDSLDNVDNLPSSTGSSYVVKVGDSLQSIALQVYGDASLWYLIADANGLILKNNEEFALSAGHQLSIPAIASRQHHTDKTHRVFRREYLTGQLKATTMLPVPPAPPPSQQNHHDCSLKKIIIGVVASLASVATVGVLAPIMGMMAMGDVLGSMVMGLATGVVGNMAGQGMGNLLGLQHGFDYHSALATGLASAATAGFASRFFGQGIGRVTQSKPNYFSPSGAIKALVNDAGNQAASLMLEKKGHFAWGELVGAASVGGIVNGPRHTQAGLLTNIGQKLVTSATQRIFMGQPVNPWQILGQSVGSSLGNVMGQQLNEEINAVDYEDAQAEEKPKSLGTELYRSYNSFLTKHEFIASILGVSGLPAAGKMLYDLADGGFSGEVLALKSALRGQGWNYGKKIFTSYSPAGDKVSMIFNNADGSVSSAHGQAIAPSATMPHSLKHYYSSLFVSHIKTASKWAPPLVLVGDGFEYGLNTYYNVPERNFSQPSDFVVDVALDIPKAAVSGAVGGVSGAVIASGVGAGLSSIGIAGESALIASAAGPVGVAAGLIAGLYVSWRAGKAIENQYTNYHLRGNLKRYGRNE